MAEKRGGLVARLRRVAGAPLRRLRRDDRGSVLAFTALTLLGLMGLLALAVDLGLLYEARGGAQRTADAAALAGAAALVDLGNDPGVEERVYEYAQPYVEQNPVRGELASVERGDVDVDLDEWNVTVTVHRTSERDNPVETLFGGIIGFEDVDVTATATAEAAEAGGVNCLLPLAIPDRWDDENDDGLYDPDDDTYIPWPESGWTGYSTEDIGTDIVIKPFDPNSDRMNSSWWYPWRPEGQQGAADYRENIERCVDPDRIYEFGEMVDTEPGNMAGPTRQGFRNLIDQDPDAYWDPELECVSRDGNECVDSSPRIRPAPMFDPREAPDPGSQPFTFRNFASVFVREVDGGDVRAVFMGFSGIGQADPSGSTTGPAVRFTRLIR